MNKARDLRRGPRTRGKSTHGWTGTPTYKVWQSIRDRVKHNPKYTRYGIKVCDRWLNSFENFLADMGRKPRNMSIDRIDTNGNYEPGNCRWATVTEQNRNRRNTIAPIIDAIKERFAAGARQKDVIEEFGISSGQASRIANGIRWES